MPTPRPSRADVYAKLEQRRTHYQQMHADQLKDWGYLTWSSSTEGQAFAQTRLANRGFPEGYIFKLPPIAKVMLQSGVEQIMTGEVPDVNVELPAGLHRDEEKFKEQLQQVKAFCKGWLFMAANYSTENPLNPFVDNTLGLGLGTLFYPLNYDKWPDYPFMVGDKQRAPRGKAEKAAVREWERKRQHAFPWDVQSLAPNNVFLDFSHDPPLDMIEEVRMKGAAALYPDLGIAQGDAESTRVTYISEDWYGIWVDQRNILTEADGADDDGIAPNPTKVSYFKAAWSGLGQQDHLGRPEYRGAGLLRSMWDAMDVYTAGFNSMEVLRLLAPFPKLDVTGPTQEEANEEAKAFRMGSAGVLPHSANISLKYLVPPPVPEVAFQEMSKVDQLFEMWVGPEVLSGVHRSEPLGALRSRLAQRKARYLRTKINCEQAVAAMLMDVLYMVKHQLDAPVTVWLGNEGKSTPITLDPKDIPDGLMITVDFSPPTQEERAFKMQEGLQLLAPDNMGVPKITRFIFLTEYANREDAQEIEDDLFIERILDLPQMLEAPAKVVLARWQSRLPQLQEEADMAQVQEGGLPLPNEQAIREAAPLTGLRRNGEQAPPPALGGFEDVQQQAQRAVAIPQYVQ